MQREYDSWQKASHHTSAVCVDCHLPEAFVPKYLAKAENGWRHGKLFTTGGFVEPIEVKPAGISILENNCVRCHGEITGDMRLHATQGARSDHPGNVSCLHCHSGVGHGEKAGLGGPLRAEELERLEQLTGASVSAAP
jgi:cytochrome c nitrite reductase small subunit